MLAQALTLPAPQMPLPLVGLPDEPGVAAWRAIGISDLSLIGALRQVDVAPDDLCWPLRTGGQMVSLASLVANGRITPDVVPLLAAYLATTTATAREAVAFAEAGVEPRVYRALSAICPGGSPEKATHLGRLAWRWLTGQLPAHVTAAAIVRAAERGITMKALADPAGPPWRRKKQPANT